MNSNEKKLVGILKDLKANYGVIGIKAEFEAEAERHKPSPSPTKTPAIVGFFTNVNQIMFNCKI